ncbi:SCO-spondin-like [Ruditapes philippinarum]|uniref:SCO-spondin-like n=1 Tax=Ruditapes philippinarum TaxID=129788 RepID=UPI00295B4B42|nr:SCO-spondin-like [Ruditapes philippinarum]
MKSFLITGLIFWCTSITCGLLLEDSVEARLATLEVRFEQLSKELAVVQGCSSDYCDIHWTKWAAWGAWSKCTGQCDKGYGSSEQTRTRARTCIGQGQEGQAVQCTGDSTETDKRPCNAVELYGCLNTAQSTNNTYGMVYNFFDELAQSACTAAVKTASHVLALRRNCNSGKAPQCSQICSNAGYSCFDELHVYPPHNVLKPDVYTDEGKTGLMMFRYFSCSFVTGGCGPNYCCCQY